MKRAVLFCLRLAISAAAGLAAWLIILNVVGGTAELFDAKSSGGRLLGTLTVAISHLGFGWLIVAVLSATCFFLTGLCLRNCNKPAISKDTD